MVADAQGSLQHIQVAGDTDYIPKISKTVHFYLHYLLEQRSSYPGSPPATGAERPVIRCHHIIYHIQIHHVDFRKAGWLKPLQLQTLSRHCGEKAYVLTQVFFTAAGCDSLADHCPAPEIWSVSKQPQICWA